MTITIPNWLPPRLNEFTDRHWAVRSRYKKAAKEMIGGYALLCRIPPAIGRRRVTLTLTMLPGQRRPDVDAYWKAVLDSLVCCKAIRGDDPKWVEIAPVVYRRGAEKATVIALEEIPRGDSA